MNSENRYQVTASLFMLKEIKSRHERVGRGYQLLKRKVEAMRFRGRQAAAELAATQGILGHTLKEAYISLAAVKFTNGESNAMVLENVGEAQVRVLRVPENISGVSTVSLQAVEEAGDGAGDTLRYAGLGAGGHRTGEAKKSFREAVRLLIKFASLRNTCILLDEAIKSTLRKVNGIEKVIIPKLKNTEAYILMEMDEREAGYSTSPYHSYPMSLKATARTSPRYFKELGCLVEIYSKHPNDEREDFHRLKMVKAKKVRRQRLALLHAQDGNDDGEDESILQELELPYCRYPEVMTSIINTYYPGHPRAHADDAQLQPVCFNIDDDEDLLF